MTTIENLLSCSKYCSISFLKFFFFVRNLMHATCVQVNWRWFQRFFLLFFDTCNYRGRYILAVNARQYKMMHFCILQILVSFEVVFFSSQCRSWVGHAFCALFGNLSYLSSSSTVVVCWEAYIIYMLSPRTLLISEYTSLRKRCRGCRLIIL